jgi:hypothetical protein
LYDNGAVTKSQAGTAVELAQFLRRLSNGGRADIFEATVRLAKEYGLAVRVFAPSTGEALQSQGPPTNEHNVLDSYRLDTAGKSARYYQLLRDLPVGLSEWAVHPGLEDGE